MITSYITSFTPGAHYGLLSFTQKKKNKVHCHARPHTAKAKFTGCIVHIQRLISVHIHDPNIHSTQCNIHSTFSAHSLSTYLDPSSGSFWTQMAHEGRLSGVVDQRPQTQLLHWQDLFFCTSRSLARVRTGMEHLQRLPWKALRSSDLEASGDLGI